MINATSLLTAMNERLKFRPRKSDFKKGLWSFVITFACLGVLSSNLHFIKSYTDSMPEHYFIQLPRISPRKGDLTLVYNGWYKGRIIKRIIGVAGDRISSDEQGNIWISDEKMSKKVGQAVDKGCGRTEGGITLTKIKPQVIPEGKVFLYSPHPLSFDSRYEQVGLVSVSDLEGLVIAIV